MAKKYISDFTGGLNDVTRSDLLADNQVTECINYEITGTGNLEKRKSTEIFDPFLDEILEELFSISTGGSILSISQPYYPPLKLEQQANDFFLFVFGINSSSNRVLYALYEEEVEDTTINPWTYQYTNEAGSVVDLLHSYKSLKASFVTDFLNFDVGSEKANFTNGSDPNGFFYVDNKRQASSGTLGFDPPLNPPIIKSLRDDTSNRNLPVFSFENFTRDADVEYVSEPGYIQVVYSYVTEDGFESNPSPVSAVADYAFFHKDSDRINTQKLNKFIVSNLSIPSTMGSEYVSRVKYFNIYARVFKSLKALASKNFEFVQQVGVVSKSRWGSNTENTYEIERPLEPGNIATYENDAAPMSKFVATTGGVTFLGNTKNALGIPGGDFKYKAPISIYNSNNHTFIDAPIQLRVWDSQGNPDDDSKKISSLKWKTFFTFNQSMDAADLISTPNRMSEMAREHIKLYHQDMHTPLKTVYKRGSLSNAANSYVDLMVKIPQLPPGTTTIYLTFNDIEGGDPANSGSLYPRKIDTLSEISNILQYFTSDSEHYTFFQSVEQSFINNNISDSQLEEMSRRLYSHPFLTSLNTDWPSTEDVDPLYKYGLWVCGDQSSPISTPAMQDMTVKEHIWGDSTLVSCSTNQTILDNNIAGDDAGLGFVNQAYMNYGGYTRYDNNREWGLLTADGWEGTYGTPYTEYDGDYVACRRDLSVLERDSNYGRVIARDHGEGSFWGTFENYSNTPGGARPNSRVTNSAFKTGHEYAGISFGGIGFNGDDMAQQGTQLSVFFHVHIPGNGSSYNLANFLGLTSEWSWRTALYSQYHHDYNTSGYYSGVDDVFGEAGAGSGFFDREEQGPGCWAWMRPLFDIRTAFNNNQVSLDGHLEPQGTPTGRFRFGMVAGKAQRGQSDEVRQYHPFLSNYEPNGTHNDDIDKDKWTNQFRAPGISVINDQYFPGLSLRAASPSFTSRDTASWLDEYPTLWGLYLGAAAQIDMPNTTWFDTNDENAHTPRVPDQMRSTMICYTGNMVQGQSNDIMGPITGGQPMDKKVMPPSWNDRPADYFICLSFQDGVDDVESAKSSLFVCNTGGTEPFESSTFNILDSDSKIYCPTDAKQVTNIKKDGDSNSFLKAIIGKDGFNFGAPAGWSYGFDRENMSDSPTNYKQRKQSGAGDRPHAMKGMRMSELHIEYGEYFDGSSVEAKTAFNYAAFGFHFMKEGIGWVPPRRSESVSAEHNKNITYGDTFEDDTVLNNRTVRWSDMGGAHYPDLNYKFVKEPIEALMPAPGFLRDEYQNCMLVFTRNMIYRFVLVGSPDGTWAAQSDNLIEEYNQYGLFAPKSLVKAGNALFWLSESGIVMFDSKGLRLVDKNKVKVNINKDAVGFYNPISNQYVLTNV